MKTKVGAILLILFSGFGSNVSAQAGDLGAWSLDPLFTYDFRVSLIEMTRQDVYFAVGGFVDSDEGFVNCSIYKKTNITSNWILLGATPICFNYLTGSADGLRLTAAAWGSEIYTSSDGGINWVNQSKADSWWGFSSSSSGQIVIGITEKKTFWLSRGRHLLRLPRGAHLQNRQFQRMEVKCWWVIHWAIYMFQPTVAILGEQQAKLTDGLRLRFLQMDLE